MHFRHIPLVTTLLLALLTLPAFADKLLSVDLRSKVITVETPGGIKVYHYTDATEVRVNSQLAHADALTPGMQLTLGFADPQTVTRIFGAAAEPEKPALGMANVGTRHITMKMKVDGKDVVMIKDGKLWIEHKDWSKPTEISINGRTWKPVWTGNKSDEYITFIPPLAPFSVVTPVEVKKAKGRGSVTMKQAPKLDNGQALMVIFDDGTESGADLYECKISW